MGAANDCRERLQGKAYVVQEARPIIITIGEPTRTAQRRHAVAQ